MEAESGRGTTLVLGGTGKAGSRVAATGVWDVAGREPAGLPG